MKEGGDHLWGKGEAEEMFTEVGGRPRRPFVKVGERSRPFIKGGRPWSKSTGRDRSLSKESIR